MGLDSRGYRSQEPGVKKIKTIQNYFKKTFLCFAGIIILSGRISPPPSRAPNADEWHVFYFAKDYWEDNIRMFPKYCNDEFKEIRIIKFLTPEETHVECGPVTSGCHITTRHGFLAFQWTSTIVYTADDEADHTLIHEFAHFASMCTYQNTDSDHEKKSVWVDWLSCTYNEYQDSLQMSSE